ncbi:4-carboxymuconolactone decarboxylase family protein [Polychaeton citri CBS 116435]|uniref:4-carboxymuconolactone decarboxylase family protein n=1 Tax=Polychaeton citri CBS 116435 TaxID=1314669 RepID=A0A9P4UUF3_9PEZI|nr:4-carboxymuconolactone decarboxylase family protein [Polychaeton citri CBS 116435]
MRIPYAPSTPKDATPENVAIYDRIASRRHPRPITKLDLALLHNPAIADGWNSLLGAIRTKSSLSQALLELCICRVAVLNHAVYEWDAHAPLALKAGCKRDALDAVLSGELRNANKLSETEMAVLAFTEESTEAVEVSEATFAWVREVLDGDDNRTTELAVAVAGYNMVSRFLVSLNVGEANGQEMVVPEHPT